MPFKQLWCFIAMLTGLMATSGVAAAQTESIRIGKKGEIELAQPTRLGTALLQPGHYEVQHAVLEGQHSVVVREQVRPARRHTAQFTGNEVARVPCRVVTLDKPPRSSSVYWTKGADGKATITEIRIADEPAGHLIVLEPSSAP